MGSEISSDRALRTRAAIQFRPYSIPLVTPYRWAKGTQHNRRGILVRADLDGALGFGEIAPPPDQSFDADNLIQVADDLVDGLDVMDRNFIKALDDRSPPARVRCGISAAWFAARGATAQRSLGAELVELIGIDRDPAHRVPVNGLITEAAPAEAVARTVSILEAGMDTIKIKCTDARDLDLRRVAAIRQAAPAATLRLDPNESWRKEWIEGHLMAMAQFEVEYVEQPLPRETAPETMAAIRKSSPVPIAADQVVLGLKEAEAILNAHAADALILKAPRLGGPDRVLQVARLAAHRGIPTTVTASLETAVGLHTALHCASLLDAPIPACGLGTARFLEHDVGTPPTLSSGRMEVPKTPGLGVTIPWQSEEP